MKRMVPLIVAAMLWGCPAAVPPDVVQQWQGRTLYTCCNIHYEQEDISDANYYVGSTLPFASPVKVEAMTATSMTVASGPTKLALYHNYGRNQETSQQYFSKIFVDTDPTTRFDSYSAPVREAIRAGRVEVGMTRDQVIMSLGYPPTHQTASIESDTWNYWYNRWKTYQVKFGSNGKVDAVLGGGPTSNQPIMEPTPAPAKPAKPAPKKKR